MPILALVELGAAVQGWHSKSWTSLGSEAALLPTHPSAECLYPHLTCV